jgi:uncharacterized membrane protein
VSDPTVPGAPRTPLAPEEPDETDSHAPFRRPAADGADGADGPAGAPGAPGAAGAAQPVAAGLPRAPLADDGRPAVAGSLPVRDRPVKVALARRGPRRARLVVKHIDPWTVMKISFVVSLVVLVVVVVATGIIYAVLGKMGVWDQINNLVNSVATTTSSKALHNPLTARRIVGVVAAVGAINVVLMTALATLGAAIYNLISDLVGGIEVTLSDP